MAWDRDRYRLEVLEPARRAGHVPPPDLFVRYGLDAGLTGRTDFRSQVDRVVAYWRELKGKRTYARLAEALLAAHGELERSGELTPAAFARRREDARREAVERLARLAAMKSDSVTHVGPADVTLLRNAVGGGVDEAQVRKALTDAGVKVVPRLPELPPAPPPKFADLAKQLHVLDLQLSPQVVFGDDVRRGFRVLGGFRLADGRRLDESAIRRARERTDALPHTHSGKTPKENALAILGAAARDEDGIRKLVLWEVLEALRPFVTGALPQKAIAMRGHELGLDEDEAGIIAAAMMAGDTVEAARRRVDDELSAGRLRAAQQVATALPSDDPLRERIAERLARIEELAAWADAELTAGRTEKAARTLAEACRLAADDRELAGRLAALPPPAPRGVRARVEGDRLLITWQPSPTRAGTVSYRVVRGQGGAPALPAEGTLVVSRTGTYEATDAEAPVGVDLHYSVFATRGGAGWSRPATAPAVEFVPEVADVTIEAEETSVSASWRVHPGADGVVVTRTEGGRAGTDTEIETSSAGFIDEGLRPSTEYRYRIRTAYRVAAGRRLSPGVVVSAFPSSPPLPVTDLAVRLMTGTEAAVEASWTPPKYGRVALRIADRPAPWPAGTRLAGAEAGAFGTPVPGVPRPDANGRVRLRISPPRGRHYLIPVTDAGHRAVVGTPVELGTAEPVTGLTAERRHDEVLLSWVWPQGAADALISWPGGERRCSRRSYEDEGGFTLRTGPDAQRVQVRAVHPHQGGELTALAAEVTVPARGVAVRYRIRRTGLRRRRIIEFTAERSCRLPELVVVRSRAAVAPGRPDEGEPVVRIAPQPIDPERPVTVAVPRQGRERGWIACFVAAQTPGSAEVLLFPPPERELRTR